MDDGDLSSLRCPSCFGSFELERAMELSAIACAIVRCPCARFPVVGGVLVVDRRPGEWHESNPSLLRVVDSGDGAALERFLLAQHQIPAEIARGTCTSFFAALDAAQAVGVSEARAEWLLHMRYWHRTPKSLALVALAERMAAGAAPPRVLLDFGAGAGHVARLVGGYVHAQRVIALDASLLFLLLARWLVDDLGPVTRVCCDGALPLPVVDAACDAIVSADAIHYMVPKASVLVELARVATRDATVCLTHLHNARSTEEPYQGFALEPAVWRALCERACGPGGSLVEDDAVRSLGSADPLPPAADDASVLSLTYLRCGAARTGAPAPIAAPFDAAIVNPAYDVVRDGDTLVLTRRVLSASYEAEFAVGQAPASARITRAELADPQARARLRRSGVVIDAPPHLLADPVRLADALS